MKYEKGYWLNADARKFLSKDYLMPGTTPESRIREIAESAQKILGIDGFADKFEDYVLRGWFSLASPIWMNFGNGRGLSISCNGSYISDSMDSIIAKHAEICKMTKNGAGTSAYFGSLRHRGALIKNGGNGKSNGPVHFMEMFEKATQVVSQSSMRRGACAAYLNVEHPDILEFLSIRSQGHNIQELSFGVCISDDWMKQVIAGDKAKRDIWQKIILTRYKTGYPYIFFTDNANNNAADVYKDKKMKIWASNLCTEIMLPSNDDESFVCDLSSMNLLHYDEWKDTDAVFVLTAFLDAVMSDYIENVKDIKFMEAAYNFARRHRALGIGTLGWHSFLQSKLIPFESMEAKLYNVEIHKNIYDNAIKASQYLAKLLGEPEVMVGYGRRNSTVCAIAPTVSSSFILGQVSQGIEPYHGNYFISDNAKGQFSRKNPFLKKVLNEYNKDTNDVWQSILSKGGSVQHLDFLTQIEKDVFKTFGEISQLEIVTQAFQRQKFVDQGQSLNLMIHPKTPLKDVSKLLIYGWENGIKSFYYHKGTNAAQELARNILDCASCQA